MFFNKKIKGFAPVSGRCESVEKSSDSVFSGKVLGDGVVIHPDNGHVVAPFSGKIIQFAHTLHAFTMESEGGVELLCHLGVDTVKLDGEGFIAYKQVGDTVKAGDHVLEMDLNLIRSKELSPEVLCIILNLDDFKTSNFNVGHVEAGKSEIFTLSK